MVAAYVAVVVEELQAAAQGPEEREEDAERAAEAGGAGQVGREEEAGGGRAREDEHDEHGVDREDLPHERCRAGEALAVAQHPGCEEVHGDDEELDHAGQEDECEDDTGTHRGLSAARP